MRAIHLSRSGPARAQLAVLVAECPQGLSAALPVAVDDQDPGRVAGLDPDGWRRASVPSSA